jgi:very-short-patch-repair endonuclease
VHLLELLPYPAEPGPVDITITGPHRGHQEGIRLHRTTSLKRYELRERHGIPVTAAPRTLIDFAASARSSELEQAVAEAFALGLTNRALLLRAIEDAPGRRGVARLRSLLEGERRPKRTRSKPEHELLVALRAAGVLEPETNYQIGRWEVDFYWPKHSLIFEVDGYAAHSSPTAFERDRRKAAELADLGLEVRRISAKQVRDELKQTVERIAAALAARSSSPASQPRRPGGARARPSAG